MKKCLLGLMVVAGGLVAACSTGSRPGAAPAPPTEALSLWRGTIVALDQKARLVTIKRVLARATFEVPPRCEIVTRLKPDAALADLRVGDEVEVLYHGDPRSGVASRLAHTGVTASDRAAERDREHLQRLMTPNPSERGLP